MMPMTTAAHTSTYAQPAVIPTSPASAPLAAISKSALPVRSSVRYIAAVAPAAPAISVLTAFSPSESELMLNPNQPKNRMNVPITTYGTLWPRMVMPCSQPLRGPTTIAPASARNPPIICTTPEPA